jgi:hypothetical protein
MADEKGPDEKSSDYKAMEDYWALIDAINGGADAMRKCGDKYLPKFPNEEAADHTYRKATAPFTNIYTDVSTNLASKPFAQDLKLADGSPQNAQDIAEDIDGQGNNLHKFAASWFQDGIDYAVDWVLIDYTKAPPLPEGRPRTVAEENDLGLRPYWCHIHANRIIAIYSDFVDGEEAIVHARIREDVVERVGFEEVVHERIRIFDRAKNAATPGSNDVSYAPATYEVWEKTDEKDPTKPKWKRIEGPEPVAIEVIALVPFWTGKRIGTTWQFKPKLRDIAHLQVEEFQQESNLKSVLEATAYPMLAANGISGTDAKGALIKVPVGPRCVLFAPPDGRGSHGEWTYLEPSAQSITALQAQLEATQKNMRDLGMQPLTTANLTVITTANVSMKAQSAVQAWALQLKDSIELAWKFTMLWLKDETTEIEVEVYTDFGVDFEATKELDALLKAEGQGIFTKRTVQMEFKRRGTVSETFDPDKEEEDLAAQQEALMPEEVIDPATGLPLKPQPGAPKPPGKTPPTVVPKKPAAVAA